MKFPIFADLIRLDRYYVAENTDFIPRDIDHSDSIDVLQQFCNRTGSRRSQRKDRIWGICTLPAVSDKDYDPESKAEEVLLGDISMDNTINLFDMVMCLNHTAQKTILYGNAWIAGDVNEDGEINLFDLMNLLNYIAHDREKMFL